MSAWRELSATRSRRHLAAAEPAWPGGLPPLSDEERALMACWLTGSAAAPRWSSLLRAAGVERLDLADRLLHKALAGGLCTLKQTRELGRAWQPHTVCWIELDALQREFKLATAADRIQRKQTLAARLDALMDDELVGEAAQALAGARVDDATESRAALLEALRSWVAGGHEGLRRNFSLHVDHSKAVKDGEWQWLERYFNLPSLGIDPFAATVTLASDLCLQWPGDRRMDLGAAAFLTLPVQALATLQLAAPRPRRWWLIENRASFEKQAARRAAGDALVWIAGRPTRSWHAALAQLLTLAPAPAAVSADADPAGIEIALAAAAPWDAAGLPWTATAMEAVHLDRPGLQPLGRYDRGVLARLGQRALPPELAALRDALDERGVKAEQEGWL